MQRKLLITDAVLNNHHALNDIRLSLNALPDGVDTILRKAFIKPLLAYAEEFFLAISETGTQDFQNKANMFNFIVTCILDQNTPFDQKSFSRIDGYISKYKFMANDKIHQALKAAEDSFQNACKEQTLVRVRASVNKAIEDAAGILKTTQDEKQAFREKISTFAEGLILKLYVNKRDLPIEKRRNASIQFNEEFGAYLEKEVNALYVPLRQNEIAAQAKKIAKIVGACSAALSAACWAYDYQAAAISFGVCAGAMFFYQAKDIVVPESSIERVEFAPGK